MSASLIIARNNAQTALTFIEGGRGPGDNFFTLSRIDLLAALTAKVRRLGGAA
jgi:hypothetical protein